MIIDETHQKWMSVSAVIAVIATLAYLLYVFRAANGPSGGSWPGLLFAAAGTALIVFECLLSLRKKYPASPLGRVQTWMRAHLWLGLLSFLLILLHAGFHWGRGLALVLMWLFTIIMVSGIYGIAVQQYIPRRMTELVTRETYALCSLVLRRQGAADGSEGHTIEEKCQPIRNPRTLRLKSQALKRRLSKPKVLKARALRARPSKPRR